MAEEMNGVMNQSCLLWQPLAHTGMLAESVPYCDLCPIFIAFFWPPKLMTLTNCA